MAMKSSYTTPWDTIYRYGKMVQHGKGLWLHSAR